MGMLKKFVAGAAQTGADILKQERLAESDAQRQRSLEELRAKIQQDLLLQQQRFSGEMQEKQHQFQRWMAQSQQEFQGGMAERDAALRTDLAGQEREFRLSLADREARYRQELERLRAANERALRTQPGALGTDEEGKVVMGQWDPKTGRLMAGGKTIEPLRKEEDVGKLVDVAKAYIEAGDVDSARKVLDDITRARRGGKPGALPQIRDPLAAPQPEAREETPRTKRPGKPQLDDLDIRNLKNIVRAQPNSARGRAAAAKLRELGISLDGGEVPPEIDQPFIAP